MTTLFNISDPLIPPDLASLENELAANEQGSGTTLTEIEACYRTPANGLSGAIIASASRKARQSQGSSPSLTYLLGATFTGPLFYGFVAEALRAAEAKGIKKLYFLARDGYLLHKIAQEILRQNPRPLELGYLYISRQSIYLAALFEVTEQSICWAFDPRGGRLSLKKIEHRLQLELVGSNALSKDQQLEKLTPDETLNEAVAAKIRTIIVSNTALKDAILTRAEDARSKLVGYLSEQGITPGETLGLVDVGWRGTIQDCLRRILAMSDASSKAVGYYYGCLAFNSETNTHNTKTPYQIYPSSRPSPAAIIEVLMAANHGTTLAYEANEDGTYSPILKPHNMESSKWNFNDYSDGIVNFTREVAAFLKCHPQVELNYKGIDNNLLEKLEVGAVLIAESIGDLSYDSGLEEGELRTMAPPFTFVQALAYLFGSKSKRAKITMWYQGSYLRSPMHSKLLLAFDPRSYFSSAVKRLRTSKET